MGHLTIICYPCQLYIFAAYTPLPHLQVPDGDDPGAILPDEDGVSPVADPALQHSVPAHRHPAASNINIANI